MAKKSFLEQIAKDSGKSAVIDTVLGTTPEAELKTAKQIKTQPENVQADSKGQRQKCRD